MTIANQSVRIHYLDILKVVFILCVLLQHLPEYLGYNPLDLLGIRVFTEQLGGIGVSGFVILSGFGLTYARLATRSPLNLWTFWRQRLLRVTPLYYLSLVAWLFAVALIPPQNLLAHLLFVHVFFRDFAHNPGSLWYVGLIVQCYLVFPLLFRMFQRNRQNLAWLLILSAYALGVALISAGYYLSDTVLMYGPEFLLGMGLAQRVRRGRPDSYLAPAGLLTGLLIFLVWAVVYQTAAWSDLNLWITWPLTTAGRIGFFLVALNLASRVSARRLTLAAAPLAFASYAVFLFHRPMWTLAINSPLWGWIGRLPDVLIHSVQFVYLALLGIPLIFVVAYWMQYANDRTLVALRLQR